MKGYIPETDSIHYVYGDDTEAVLHTMAYRFMGDHPPMPFILRAFYENGVSRHRDGSAVFDFQRLLPEAQRGDWGAAIGELWCPEEKKSRFLVRCESETLVYLNQKLILLCCNSGTYEFAAALNKGMNRFLIVSKKEAGFFCTLKNKMPQWEPCSYIMPFEERDGEAGFNYTFFKADEITQDTAEKFFLGEQFWGTAEKETGKSWMPDTYVSGVPWKKEGQIWFGWTEVRTDSLVNLNEAWEELICFLRKQKEKNSCVKAVMVNGHSIDEPGKNRVCQEETWECKGRSRYQISWLICTDALSCDTWLPVRENMKWKCCMPVQVKGNCGKALFLGPLDSSAEKKLMNWVPDSREFFTKPFQITDKGIFWKTEYPELVIRPFVESHLFGRWTYPLGVTLYGMLQTGLYYKKHPLTEYVRDSIEAVVMADRYAAYDREKYGFPGINQQLLWLDALDDCGSFGSCMLEYLLNCREKKNLHFEAEAARIAGRIGRYIFEEQVRNSDGSFKRRDNSMWIDDMYMSVPFLVRYAEVFHDSKAVKEAVRQLLLYKNYFYFKPQTMKGKGHILSHMYKLEFNQANQIPWSRGNGWVVFSLSELLMRENPELPMGEELISFFQDLCEGYLELQDEDGLWHQILDEKSSYQETSAAAMFICAMSRGIRYGLLPRERVMDFSEAVFKAWKGLTQKAIDRKGNLYGVCQGSGWSYEREYYRALTWNFNDTHGIGIVMLAGVETERLKEYLDQPFSL